MLVKAVLSDSTDWQVTRGGGYKIISLPLDVFRAKKGYIH